MDTDTLMDNGEKTKDLGMELPFIPVRDTVMVPGRSTMVEILDPKSIRTAEEAYEKKQDIVVFWWNAPDGDENQAKKLTPESLPKHGVRCRFHRLLHMSETSRRLMVEGVERVALMDMQVDAPTWSGVAMSAPVEGGYTFSDTECEMMRESLIRDLKEINFSATRREWIMKDVAEIKDLYQLCDYLAFIIPSSLQLRQKYLDTDKREYQVLYMLRVIKEELEVAQIRKEIDMDVKKRISGNQRDMILREQLRVIQEKLGDDVGNSCNEYEDKLKNLEASESIKEHIAKQIRRVRSIPVNSPDSSLLRGYIETMLAMPWNHEDAEQQNILVAKQCLEEDHYGLEKIKERILDYLAVRIKNGGKATTILCLVGPPGTGKTSIVASIARALGRKYVRMSLGGVHDEAEIRGHRKTYVGAMPGRIAEAIKQAGVKNPVILLDELDKLGSDFRGDPASALLEVLDPEQNKAFVDHFIEMPLDLSQVFFVATANDASKIPSALYDRMEILELSSYTENEKLHIAQDYLVKKQCDATGLDVSCLEVPSEALVYLMRCYTKEAGVRGLERRIGELCRKLVRQEMESGAENVHVTLDSAMIKTLLGKERYPFEPPMIQDQVGMVRGLAWTSVGGDTLEIEVAVLPGKGELRLTGKLGDVMKESAMTALSYVRSIAENHEVSPDFFETHDLHVHVPEGAVPKDGPSAGITLATALLSAITGEAVRGDVAMTGEVTLRGHVLPIGGLKEKLLAARNAGMQRVLVPERNRVDVADISAEILGNLDICYVSEMSEVLPLAMRR